MSNRQARREQMRTTRQQRDQQRPARSSSPGPRRGGGGGGVARMFSQPFLLIVAALIIVLAGVLTWLVASGGTDTGGAPEKLAAARQNFPYDLAKGTKVGKDDAPLKLVQYEDFQCPFCLKYTSEQEPTLVEEYVKTGKVQIEYKHLPNLGAESVRAGRASECAADQGKFWQYHDKLFQVQADAGQLKKEKVNAGRFSDDKLRQFAKELGLEENKFNTCFISEDSLKLVQDDQREAQSFGINGTPGFTINGRAMGSGAPAKLEDWRKLLDDQIKAATASPTPSATASASPASTATAAATPATPAR